MPCSNESDYRRVTGRSPLGRRERRRILRNEIESVMKKKDLGPSLGMSDARDMNPATAIDADLDRLVLEGIPTINLGRGVPDPTPFGTEIPKIPETRRVLDAPEKIEARTPDEPRKKKLKRIRKIIEPVVAPKASPLSSAAKKFGKINFQKITKKKKPKKKKLNYSTVIGNMEKLLTDFPVDYSFVPKPISDDARSKLGLTGAAGLPAERIRSGAAIAEISEQSINSMKNIFQMIGSQTGNQYASLIDSRIAKMNSAQRPVAPRPPTGSATLLGAILSVQRSNNEEFIGTYGVGDSDLFSENYVSSMEKLISQGFFPETASYLVSNFNDMDGGQRKAANMLGMSDRSLRRLRRAAEKSNKVFGVGTETIGLAKVDSDPFEVATAVLLARNYLLENARKNGVDYDMWRAVSELTGANKQVTRRMFSSIFSANRDYLGEVYGDSRNVSEYGNGLLRLASGAAANMSENDATDLNSMMNDSDSGAMAIYIPPSNRRPRDINPKASLIYPMHKRQSGSWSEIAKDVQKILRKIKKNFRHVGDAEPKRFSSLEKDIGQILLELLPYSFTDYAREIAILQAILRDRVEFNLLPIGEVGSNIGGKFVPDVQKLSVLGQNGLLDLFEPINAVNARTPERDLVPKPLSLVRAISLLTEALDIASRAASEILATTGRERFYGDIGLRTRQELERRDKSAVNFLVSDAYRTRDYAEDVDGFSPYEQLVIFGRGMKTTTDDVGQIRDYLSDRLRRLERITNFGGTMDASKINMFEATESGLGDEIIDAIRGINEAWFNTLLPSYVKPVPVADPSTREIRELSPGSTARRYRTAKQFSDALAETFDSLYMRNASPDLPSSLFDPEGETIVKDRFFDAYEELLPLILDPENPSRPAFTYSEIDAAIRESFAELLDRKPRGVAELMKNLLNDGLMEDVKRNLRNRFGGYDASLGGDPRVTEKFRFVDAQSIIPRLTRERSARRLRRATASVSDDGDSGRMGGFSVPRPIQSATGGTPGGIGFDKNYVRSGDLANEMRQIDENSKRFWDMVDDKVSLRVAARGLALLEDLKDPQKLRSLIDDISSLAPTINGQRLEPYSNNDAIAIVKGMKDLFDRNELSDIANNSVTYDPDRPWTANVMTFLMGRQTGKNPLPKQFFGAHPDKLRDLRFAPLYYDNNMRTLRPFMESLGIGSDGEMIKFAMTGRPITGSRKHTSPKNKDNQEANYVGDVMAMFVEGPESLSRYSGGDNENDPRRNSDVGIGQAFEYAYQVYLRDPRRKMNGSPLLTVVGDPAREFAVRNDFRKRIHDLWNEAERVYGREIQGRPAPIQDEALYYAATQAVKLAETNSSRLVTREDFSEVMDVILRNDMGRGFSTFGEIATAILGEKAEAFRELSGEDLRKAVINSMTPELKKKLTDKKKRMKTAEEIFFASAVAIADFPWDSDDDHSNKKKEDWIEVGKRIGELNQASVFYDEFYKYLSENGGDNAKYFDARFGKFITSNQLSVIVDDIAPGLTEGIFAGESGRMSKGEMMSEEEYKAIVAARNAIVERVRRSRFLSSLDFAQEKVDEINELAEKADKLIEWKRARLLSLVTPRDGALTDDDWFVYAAIGGFYRPFRSIFLQRFDEKSAPISVTTARDKLRTFIAEAGSDVVRELFGWVSTAIRGEEDEPTEDGETKFRTVYELTSDGGVSPILDRPDLFERSDDARNEISYIDPKAKEPIMVRAEDGSLIPKQKSPAELRKASTPIKVLTPYGKLNKAILDGALRAGLVAMPSADEAENELPLDIALSVFGGELPLIELPKSWHEPLSDEELELTFTRADLAEISKQVKLFNRRFALEMLTGEKVSPDVSQKVVRGKAEFIATPEQLSQNQALEAMNPLNQSSVKSFVNTLSPEQLKTIGALFGSDQSSAIKLTPEMLLAANGGLDEVNLSVAKLIVEAAKKVAFLRRTENGDDLINQRVATILGDSSLGDNEKKVITAVGSGDSDAAKKAFIDLPRESAASLSRSLLKPIYDLSAKDAQGNLVAGIADVTQTDAESGLQWTRNLLEHVLSMPEPLQFLEEFRKGLKTGAARRAVIEVGTSRTADPGAETTALRTVKLDGEWMKRFVIGKPVDGKGYIIMRVLDGQDRTRLDEMREKIQNFSGSSSEAAEIISLMTDEEVTNFLINKVYPALVAKGMRDKFSFGMAQVTAELDAKMRSIGRRLRKSSSVTEILDATEAAIAEAFDGRTRDMLTREELVQYGDLVAYFAAGGKQILPPEKYRSALAEMAAERRRVVQRIKDRADEETREEEELYEAMMDPPIEQSLLEALQRARDPQTIADLAEQEELYRIMGGGRIPGSGLRPYDGVDENLGESTFWKMFRPDPVTDDDSEQNRFGEGDPFGQSDTGRMTMPLPPPPPDPAVNIGDREYSRLTKENAERTFGAWTYQMIFRNYSTIFGGRGTGAPHISPQSYPTAPLTRNPYHYDRARRAIDAMWRLTTGDVPEAVRIRLENDEKVQLEQAKEWLDDLIWVTAEYMRMAGIDVPDDYDPKLAANKNNPIQRIFLDNMAEATLLALYFPFTFKIPVRSSGTEGAADWVPQDDQDFNVEGLNSADRPNLIYAAYHSIVAGDFSVSSGIDSGGRDISRWIFNPKPQNEGPVTPLGPIETEIYGSRDDGTPPTDVVSDATSGGEQDDGSPFLEDPLIKELTDFIATIILNPFGGSEYSFNEWLDQANRYSKILGSSHYEKRGSGKGLIDLVTEDRSVINVDKVLSEIIKTGGAGDEFSTPDSLISFGDLSIADPDYGPSFPGVSDEINAPSMFDNMSPQEISKQRKIGISSTSKASQAARAGWWASLQSGKHPMEIASSEKTSDGINWHPDIVEEGIRKHAKQNGIASSVVDAAFDAAEKAYEAKNLSTAKLKSIAAIREIVDANPNNLAKVFNDLEELLKQRESERKETSNQYQERIRRPILAHAATLKAYEEILKVKLKELNDLMAGDKTSKSEAVDKYRKAVVGVYADIVNITRAIRKMHRDSVASKRALDAIDEEIEQIRDYVQRAAKAVNVSVKAINQRMQMIRAIKNGIAASGTDSGAMSIPMKFGSEILYIPANPRITREKPQSLLSSFEKALVRAAATIGDGTNEIPEQASLVLPNLRMIRSGLFEEFVGLPNRNSVRSIGNSLRVALNKFASAVTAEEFLRESMGDRFVNFRSLGFNLLPEKTRRIAEDAILDGTMVSSANNGVTENDAIGAMIMHAEATEAVRNAIIGSSIRDAAEYLNVSQDTVRDAIETESKLADLTRDVTRAHSLARRLSKSNDRRYTSNFVRRKFYDLIQDGFPEERLLYPSTFSRNQAVAAAQNALRVNEIYGLTEQELMAASGSDEEISRLISYLRTREAKASARKFNDLPENWTRMSFAEKNSWLSSEEGLRAFGRFGVMVQAQLIQQEINDFGIPDGPVFAMGTKIFEKETMIPSMINERGVSRLFVADPLTSYDLLRSGNNSYLMLEDRLPSLYEISDEGMARFLNSSPELISEFRNGNLMLSEKAAEKIAKAVGLDYAEIWGMRRPQIATNEGNFYWLASNWALVGPTISAINDGTPTNSISDLVNDGGRKIPQKVSELISSGVVDAFYDAVNPNGITQADADGYIASLGKKKRKEVISILASAGYGESEIVASTGFNPNTVRNVLRETRMSGMAPAAVGSREWTMSNARAIRADSKNGVSKRELMRKYGIGARSLNSILSEGSSVAYRSAYRSDSGAMASRRLNDEAKVARREATDQDKIVVGEEMGITKDVMGNEIRDIPGFHPIVARVANPFEAENGAGLNADGTNKVESPENTVIENIVMMWKSITDLFVNYALSGGRIRLPSDKFRYVAGFGEDVLVDLVWADKVSNMGRETNSYGTTYAKTQLDAMRGEFSFAIKTLLKKVMEEKELRGGIDGLANAIAGQLGLVPSLFGYMFAMHENLDEVIQDSTPGRSRTPFKPFGTQYKRALKAVLAADDLSQTINGVRKSEDAISPLLRDPRQMMKYIPEDLKRRYTETITTTDSEPAQVEVSGFNGQEDVRVLAYVASTIADLASGDVDRYFDETSPGDTTMYFNSPEGKFIALMVALGNIRPTFRYLPYANTLGMYYSGNENDEVLDGSGFVREVISEIEQNYAAWAERFIDRLTPMVNDGDQNMRLYDVSNFRDPLTDGSNWGKRVFLDGTNFNNSIKDALFLQGQIDDSDQPTSMVLQLSMTGDGSVVPSLSVLDSIIAPMEEAYFFAPDIRDGIPVSNSGFSFVMPSPMRETIRRARGDITAEGILAAGEMGISIPSSEIVEEKLSNFITPENYGGDTEYYPGIENMIRWMVERGLASEIVRGLDSQSPGSKYSVDPAVLEEIDILTRSEPDLFPSGGRSAPIDYTLSPDLAALEKLVKAPNVSTSVPLFKRQDYFHLRDAIPYLVSLLEVMKQRNTATLPPSYDLMPILNAETGDVIGMSPGNIVDSGIDPTVSLNPNYWPRATRFSQMIIEAVQQSEKIAGFPAELKQIVNEMTPREFALLDWIVSMNQSLQPIFELWDTSTLVAFEQEGSHPSFNTRRTMAGTTEYPSSIFSTGERASGLPLVVPPKNVRGQQLTAFDGQDQVLDQVPFGSERIEFGGTQPNSVVDDQVYAYAMDQIFKKLASYGSKSSETLVNEVIFNSPVIQTLKNKTQIDDDDLRTLLDDGKESGEVVAMILSDLLAEGIMRAAVRESGANIRYAPFSSGDESIRVDGVRGENLRKFLDAVRPRRDFYGFWSMYGPDVVYSLPNNDEPYLPIWEDDRKLTEFFGVRPYAPEIFFPYGSTEKLENDASLKGSLVGTNELFDALQRSPSRWWWDRQAPLIGSTADDGNVTTPEAIVDDAERTASQYVLNMSPDELIEYLLSVQESASGRRTEESGVAVRPPNLPSILRRAFGDMNDLTFENIPYNKLDEWTGTIVSELNPRDVTPERVMEELRRIFPYMGNGDEDYFPVVGTLFDEAMETLSRFGDESDPLKMSPSQFFGGEKLDELAEISSRTREEIESRIRAIMRFPEIFNDQTLISDNDSLLKAIGYVESETVRKARFSNLMSQLRQSLDTQMRRVAEGQRMLNDLRRAAAVLTKPDDQFAKMSSVAMAINEYIDSRRVAGDINDVTAFRLKSELQQIIIRNVFGTEIDGVGGSALMMQFADMIPYIPERLESFSRTRDEARSGYKTIYDSIISSGTSPFVGVKATFPTLADVENFMSEFEKETGRPFDPDKDMNAIPAGGNIPSNIFVRILAQRINDDATESLVDRGLPLPQSENAELLAILDALSQAQTMIYAKLRGFERADANAGVFGNVKTMKDVGREISELTARNEAVKARYKLIGRYKAEVVDPMLESFNDNQEENLQKMKTFREWLADSGYEDMLGDGSDSDSGAMSTHAMVVSRFNDPARAAILYGADESMADKTDFVTTGHLLIGAWRAVESVMEEEGSLKLSQIASVTTLRNVLANMNKAAGKDRGNKPRITDFTAHAKKAMTNAILVASQRGSDLIDVADLVSAILRPSLNEGKDDGLGDALSEAGISVADTLLAFQGYLTAATAPAQADSGSMTVGRAVDARRESVRERTRARLAHKAAWFNPYGAYLLGKSDDGEIPPGFSQINISPEKINDEALVREVSRLGDIYAMSITSGALPAEDFRSGESPFDDVPERPFNSISTFGELGQRPTDLVGAIRDAITRADALIVDQTQRDRLNQYLADMKLMFDNYLHVDEVMGGDSGAMRRRNPRTIAEIIEPIRDMFAKEEKYGQKKYYEHIYGPVYDTQSQLNKSARYEAYRSPFELSNNLRIEKDDIQWSTNDWVYKKDDKFIEAADAVIIKMRDGNFATAQVAMITRKSGPFRGSISTVGGLRDGDEDLMTTAIREATEEVGLPEEMILQAVPLGMIEAPDWDPRFANGIRVAAGMFVVPWDTDLSAGSDASGAEWIPLSEIASGQRSIGFGHAEWLRRAVASMTIDPDSDPFGELRTSIARRLSLLSKAARLRNQRMIERINDIRRATGKPLLLQSGKMPHPMMPWGKKVARSVWSFGKSESSGDSGAMSAEMGRDLRKALGLGDENGAPKSEYISSQEWNGANSASLPSTLGFYGTPQISFGEKSEVEQSIAGFMDPTQYSVPSRATGLWIPYIDRSVARAAANRTTDPKAVPTAYIIGGPSGAGKSYLRTSGYDGIPGYDFAVTADPDDAKIVSPEFAYFAEAIGKRENGKPIYRGPSIAAALHEETRSVSNALYMSGMNSGLDVVYDTSGQFRDGNTLGLTKAFGYSIKGYYVFGQPGILESRVAERGDTSGRFVSRGMSETIGNNLASIIPQIVQYFDELKILDSSTNVERPKVVAIYKKSPDAIQGKPDNGQLIGQWEVLSPIFFKYVNVVGPAGAGSQEMQKNFRQYKIIPVTFDSRTMLWPDQ